MARWAERLTLLACLVLPSAAVRGDGETRAVAAASSFVEAASSAGEAGQLGAAAAVHDHRAHNHLTHTHRGAHQVTKLMGPPVDFRPNSQEEEGEAVVAPQQEKQVEEELQDSQDQAEDSEEVSAAVKDHSSTNALDAEESAAQSALSAAEGVAECDVTVAGHGGQKGVKALQDCVALLQKLSQKARAQMSTSKKANIDYAEKLKVAREQLTKMKALMQTADHELIEDYKNALSGLDPSISKLKSDLQDMEEGKLFAAKPGK